MDYVNFFLITAICQSCISRWNKLNPFRMDPILYGLFRQTFNCWRIELGGSGIIGTEDTIAQESCFTFSAWCTFNASQKKIEVALWKWLLYFYLIHFNDTLNLRYSSIFIHPTCRMKNSRVIYPFSSCFSFKIYHGR